MATDFSAVKVTPDAASYATGVKVTLTVTGKSVQPTTRQDTLSGSVVDSAGATGTFGPVPITYLGSQQNTVKIQAVTSALGVPYTISADGLTATATAP